MPVNRFVDTQLLKRILTIALPIQGKGGYSRISLVRKNLNLDLLNFVEREYVSECVAWHQSLIFIYQPETATSCDSSSEPGLGAGGSGSRNIL